MSTIQTEMALLGCLIVNGELIDDVIGELKTNDFENFFNRSLYACLIDMRYTNTPIDLTLVASRYNLLNTEKDYFGDIAEIANSAHAYQNIKGYVSIIKNESNKRFIKTLITESLHRILHNDDSYLEYLKRGILQMEINDIIEIPTYAELLSRTMKEIEEHAAAGGGIIGLSTGFSDIDNLVRGLRPGHLIVVGARPSMGKTIFMMNMADHLAFCGKSVGVFSLEMSDTEICKRSLARSGRINGTRLVEGDLNAEEWKKLGSATESLSGINLSLIYKSSLTSFDIRTMSRRIKNQIGLDAIFIDYLGKIRGYDDIKMETHRIGRITADLKALAIDFKIPVILLCQLNRNVSSRENKVPTLADLRDSGSIEQDADVVMFLDQEIIWNRESHRKNEADIIIAKNRHGAIGNVILSTQLESFEFRNFAHGHGSSTVIPYEVKGRHYGKRYTEKE